jgi:protein-disulfide isomerase
VSNRDGKKETQRVVRERLAQERLRRPTLWTTTIAAAALVIALLVGWGVWQSQQADDFAVPAGTTSVGGEDAGLLAGGDGPVTVEVYLDFLCPACKQFEVAATPTLDQLIAEKRIQLVWHTLGFLDRLSTTDYSTRSASAAACASAGGRLKAYGDVLFANQPPEGGAGLTDDQLVDLGGPAGLNAPSFAACVRDGTYEDWVAHVNDLASQRGVNKTPTVYVNGQLLSQPTPENLKAAVDSAS